MNKIKSSKIPENLILSIITVTRDDFNGLNKTIKSLNVLRGSNIELIIVDGSSSPISYDKFELHLLEFQEIKILSGPDQGIYDAMNKGLANANGRFVWFLNGGDLNLLDSIDFLHKPSENNLPIMLGNYRIGIDGYSIRRKAKKLKSIAHGLPTSHQAIFYPRPIFQNIGYNLKYEICADYASIAFLYSSGLNFVYIANEIAEFQLDGISGKNRKKLIKEANLIQQEILIKGQAQIAISRIRHNLSFLVRKCVYHLGRHKK